MVAFGKVHSKSNEQMGILVIIKYSSYPSDIQLRTITNVLSVDLDISMATAYQTNVLQKYFMHIQNEIRFSII